MSLSLVINASASARNRINRSIDCGIDRAGLLLTRLHNSATRFARYAKWPPENGISPR